MEIAELLAEFDTLTLKTFTGDDALELGAILLAVARADRLAVVIDVRTPNRTLFHAALPGAAALNDKWARRKSNTALMFGEPSFLVGTRHQERGDSLVQHGLDPADYADHGGAVPIVVDGVGTVAVATVSGLPQADDHAMVVRAIRALQQSAR